MANAPVLQLPLGFKFSTSDEQLVVQYLRRRALGESLPCAVVIDVDILQHNPWDLVPESTKEKYFFTRKELKYPGRRRANRATSEVCWRVTGSEKPVYAIPGGSGGPLLVGMKRALVFYRAQPPPGERTGWVMHDSTSTAGASLMPYRVMRRANSNSSAPPYGCAAAAIGKD